MGDSRLQDWWVVGTVLANALGVPRTTLQSAVESGHIRWRLLGDNRTVVVRWRDAEKWAEGRK